MAANETIDLDRVIATVLEGFPRLDTLAQRVSVALYRLLAAGKPVARRDLARKVDVAAETVERILGGWPGVFYDAQGCVVGYWGLALPEAYRSPHRFVTGGRDFSAWCAWDTLFLPELLGAGAEVASASPEGGGHVRLSVTPRGVARVEPAAAAMSFLVPDAKAVGKDVVASFCHFVHFFPTRVAGERWCARRPGTFMLSIDEAEALARRKNAAQYPDMPARQP
jgi:alkylmercury lyase